MARDSASTRCGSRPDTAKTVTIARRSGVTGEADGRHRQAGAKGALPLAGKLRAAVVELAALLLVATVASGQEPRFSEKTFGDWQVRTDIDQFDATKDVAIYSWVSGEQGNPSVGNTRMYFACLHGDETPFATLTRPRLVSFVSGVRIRYRTEWTSGVESVNASGAGNVVLIRGYRDLLEDLKRGAKKGHESILFQVTDSSSFFEYRGRLGLSGLEEALDHAAMQGCKL